MKQLHDCFYSLNTSLRTTTEKSTKRKKMVGKNDKSFNFHAFACRLCNFPIESKWFDLLGGCWTKSNWNMKLSLPTTISNAFNIFSLQQCGQHVKEIDYGGWPAPRNHMSMKQGYEVSAEFSCRTIIQILLLMKTTIFFFTGKNERSSQQHTERWIIDWNGTRKFLCQVHPIEIMWRSFYHFTIKSPKKLN